MLSIIIPTLNAGSCLAETLKACASPEAEIIICDGGSTDHTCEIAIEMGAKVTTTEPGRGGQLAKGANMATGDWFLFLHADSILGDGWKPIVDRFTANPNYKFRTGVFHLKLDDSAPQARRVEWWANLRTKALALPYGDQGLLISRSYYEGLGGFRPIPLMEDVDFIRRIGRAHLQVLPSHITTSAERYKRGGYWMRPLRNLSLLSLYFLGMPPKLLVKLYQ